VLDNIVAFLSSTLEERTNIIDDGGVSRNLVYSLEVDPHLTGSDRLTNVDLLRRGDVLID
jgi:hypothetical protein